MTFSPKRPVLMHGSMKGHFDTLHQNICGRVVEQLIRTFHMYNFTRNNLCVKLFFGKFNSCSPIFMQKTNFGDLDPWRRPLFCPGFSVALFQFRNLAHFEASRFRNLTCRPAPDLQHRRLFLRFTSAESDFLSQLSNVMQADGRAHGTRFFDT